MSEKTLKAGIKLTAATIALGMAAAPIAAQADANPFGMTALGSGYMVVADAKGSEGKCGEAKCGGNKAMEKTSEGKCGEAKCGGDKAMEKSSEGKCGGDKAMEKSSEAKCGEAKCGGNK